MKSKWKYTRDFERLVCSVCGAAALHDYAGQSIPSAFCPHCGKPMIPVVE